ncbi:MAG: phosphonate C-P lyase system protein PhnH [Hydrogenophaga sp.]|jgi:alpha-D-ribose 1-methylphosphonate 5-triphosphate synthase subunit PhnH|nr:phosphonate C-P lyase system protein PhnH [Hydrogenophaga sp.]
MTNEALAWLPARQQQVFRRLMTAFSYPGRVQSLEGAEGNAMRLILGTLVDGACTLSDIHHLLERDDRRRLGARMCSLEVADFILAPGTQVLEGTPRLGSLENPEQGATVVLAVSALGTGVCLNLQGPGISGKQPLRVSGVDPAWWTQRAEWNAHFPMGVDFVLVSDNAVAALPRTTLVTMEGAH